MKWISVHDKLPPEGKYVLVHLTIDNWEDETDPKGVYHVVAKLVRGISKVDRHSMRAGQLSNPLMRGSRSLRRSEIIQFGDEDGTIFARIDGRRLEQTISSDRTLTAGALLIRQHRGS